VRLNRAQSIVLVVALGVAFLAIGHWAARRGRHAVTGWTGYAPLARTSNGLPANDVLLIWLALAAVWAIASLVLLRHGGATGPVGGDPPTDGA
jgi:heme/copper-type cytochrome/quinol oxidase subunit 1